MTISITSFTPYNSNFIFDTIASESIQVSNMNNIQTAIASVKSEIEGKLGPSYNIEQGSTNGVDFITFVNNGAFGTGIANQLSIGASAIKLWDAGAETEVSGWGAKTLSSLTSSNSFYIWATFVGGAKDYEATNTTSALPSDLSEKFCIGIASVNGSGVVTFIALKDLNKPSGFREDVYFLQDVDIKGNGSVKGTMTVGGAITAPSITASIAQTRTVITSADSPYTLLPTTDILECDCSSGAITVNLYTSVGATVKKTLIKKTDTSTNFVTIDGNSTETIEGSLTQKLYAQYQGIEIYPDGTNFKATSLKDKVLIQTKTLTGSAGTADFIIGIDSTFKEYLITGDITGSADGFNAFVRYTQDGGSNWLATGYKTAGLEANSSGSGGYNTETTGVGLNAVTIGNAAGESLTLDLKITNPAGTTNRKKTYGFITFTRAADLEEILPLTGTYNTDTNAVNGFRVVLSTGNISGYLSLYGLR